MAAQNARAVTLQRERVEVQRGAGLDRRDLFPLHVQPPNPVRGRVLRYLYQRFRRRGDRQALVRDSVGSLSALASANRRSGARLAEVPEGEATRPQAPVLSRIGLRIVDAGPGPRVARKKPCLSFYVFATCASRSRG